MLDLIKTIAIVVLSEYNILDDHKLAEASALAMPPMMCSFTYHTKDIQHIVLSHLQVSSP